MKIGIITDTHAGARNDLDVLREHQNRFYREQFFPALQARGIDTIIHAGDFFDKRKQIDLKTFFDTKNVFINLLEQYGMTMYLIPGNHDIRYKDSNHINAPNLVFGDSPYVEVIEDFCTKGFDGTPICFAPWINENNQPAFETELAETKADVLIGHFDIVGFSFNKFTKSDKGFDPKRFEDFNLVMSGHYHTRSRAQNIVFLGAPFEMSWADHDDPRGFHIFDTKTQSLTETIDNTFHLFHKFNVHDPVPDDCDLENKFVKVYINGDSEQEGIDQYITNLHNRGPYDLQVVDTRNWNIGNRLDIQPEYDDTKSTEELIAEYVDGIDPDEMGGDKMKKAVNKVLINQYRESIIDR